MSTVLPPTSQNLSRAAKALSQGQLVGLPTETVYGLAGDGRCPKAIARIYAAKERPRFNPLILHVRPQSLASLAREGLIDPGPMSEEARQVATRLLGAWPGPLTVVLPRGPAVPDITAAGLDTVAVRAPDHPVAIALLTRSGPLAAPSANRSGHISPTTAPDVLSELGEAVDCVLNGGPCRVGVESTVVRVHNDGRVHLLRPGWWDANALSELAGVAVTAADDSVDGPRSPGTTLRHYAPQTPFFALPARVTELDLLPWLAGRSAALLCWTEGHATAARARLPDVRPVTLAPDGDPAEVAKELYAGLRRLDEMQVDVLLAEPFPPAELGDEGLLHALRDRVSRATEPWPGPFTQD